MYIVTMIIMISIVSGKMKSRHTIKLPPCAKHKFTGMIDSGTMKMYFRAEHCRAEHCRVDGKEAGDALCPNQST